MIGRQEIRHDCPTGDVLTELPPSVLSATFTWRCKECGQRWWCEIVSRGRSVNFTRRGRASRSWRRANLRAVRQFAKQLRELDK